MARLDVLGPVFWFEAVTAARRPRLFWLRGIYATVLLVAITFVFAAHSRTSVGTLAADANLAAMFFKVFAIVQFYALAAVTPGMFSAVVARERQRRTIDDLLVSDLSDAEIVLGKLAATFLRVGQFLLAGLPVASLAMLMGGIAPQSLFEVALITSATLVMMAGASVRASVAAKTTTQAVKQAFSRIVVISGFIYFAFTGYCVVAGLFAGSGVLQSLQDHREWMLAQPFTTIWVCLGGDLFDSVKWTPIYVSLGAQAAIGIIDVIIAVRILRREPTQAAVKNAVSMKSDRQLETGTATTPRKLKSPACGDAANTRLTWGDVDLARANESMLERHPVLWKERYFHRSAFLRRLPPLKRLAVRYVVCFLSMVLVVSIFGTIPSPVNVAAAFCLIFSLFSLAIPIFVLLRTAHCIEHERERGTWELLLASSLSGRDIVLGKCLGAICESLWLAPPFIIFWLAIGLKQPSLLMVFVATCPIVMVLTAFAAALGTAVALRVRGAMQASVISVAIPTALSLGILAWQFLSLGRFYDNDGTNMPCMAFCPPWLVAAPYQIWQEWPPFLFGRNSIWSLVLIFLAGMNGYALAAAAIFFHTCANFDRVAGRIVSGTPWTNSSPLSASAGP